MFAAERTLSVARSSRHQEGVILADRLMRLIAADEGVLSILGRLNEETKEDCIQQPLEEVRRAFEEQNGSHSEELAITVEINNQLYECRVFPLSASADGVPQEMILVYLRRGVSVSDAVENLAGKYSLSPRETQTLDGIARGLSAKEVAEEMGISHNTVKAYMRLIMGKTGVNSRGGVIKKLLEAQFQG